MWPPMVPQQKDGKNIFDSATKTRQHFGLAGSCFGQEFLCERANPMFPHEDCLEALAAPQSKVGQAGELLCIVNIPYPNAVFRQMKMGIGILEEKLLKSSP